jgi:hypothetical protein
MVTETKVFQFYEVETHGDPKDCWLIIHGKVYDVTKFLEHHPGGDDVLLSATGIEFLGLTYFLTTPLKISYKLVVFTLTFSTSYVGLIVFVVTLFSFSFSFCFNFIIDLEVPKS